MTRTDILNAGLAALTATTLALMAASPGRAEGGAPACGPRAGVIGHLATRFGETRRGIGLGTGQRVLEVFASDETGTWTVTVTLPDGRTCLLASGRHWEDRMDDLGHLGDAEA